MDLQLREILLTTAALTNALNSSVAIGVLSQESMATMSAKQECTHVVQMARGDAGRETISRTFALACNHSVRRFPMRAHAVIRTTSRRVKWENRSAVGTTGNGFALSTASIIVVMRSWKSWMVHFVFWRMTQRNREARLRLQQR